MKTQFRIRRAWIYGDRFEVAAYGKDGDNVIVWDPVVLRVLTEQEKSLEQEPTFRMTTEDAQQLMDELWHVGLRPTEGHRERRLPRRNAASFGGHAPVGI